MFKGSMVALVTPMHEDGTIARKSLLDLVEWHIAEKTDAIVVVGTTGESATLDTQEQYEIIRLIMKHVAHRIPVIAGAGTNATKTTLTRVAAAKEAGVDAVLLVTPYYNKPTQNGLYAHYKTIAQAVDLPIILYNIPGRTGCDLLPETVEKLAKINTIIGIKEGTGIIERAQEISSRCNKNFAIYSGDDASALELMKEGAVGVISVTANLAPRLMHDLCEAALKGDEPLALQINQKLELLHQRLFLESNPIPSKWALHHLGKIPPGIRMPLLPLDTRYHQEVKEALQIAGVT